VTVARVGRARGFNGIVAIGITANIAAKILNSAVAEEIVIGKLVVAQLPVQWQQHAHMHTERTGFVQQPENLPAIPYSFYKFDAHWSLAA